MLDTTMAIFTVPRFGGTIERVGPYFALAIHPDGRTALATQPAAGANEGKVLVLRASTWEMLDAIRVSDMQPFEVAWSPNGRWALVLDYAGPTFKLLLLSANGRVVDQVEEPRFGSRAFPRVRWTPQSDGRRVTKVQDCWARRPRTVVDPASH